MNSHLTTLINLYLRKPKTPTPSLDNTQTTQSSQTTNRNISDQRSLSPTNNSQATQDMSSTEDEQWKLTNTKTSTLHDHDTPTPPTNMFSNNMYNTLIDPTENSDSPQPTNRTNVNQTNRKDQDTTVTFQQTNSSNLP